MTYFFTRNVPVILLVPVVYWQDGDSVVIVVQLLCYVLHCPTKPNVQHTAKHGNVSKGNMYIHHCCGRMMRRMQSSM